MESQIEELKKSKKKCLEDLESQRAEHSKVLKTLGEKTNLENRAMQAETENQSLQQEIKAAKEEEER